MNKFLVIVTLLLTACSGHQYSKNSHQDEVTHVEALMQEISSEGRKRFNAAEDLWHLGYRKEVIPFLSRTLASTSPSQRRFALGLLRNLDNPPPEVVHSVEIMATSETNRTVRNIAIQAIQRWKIIGLTNSIK